MVASLALSSAAVGGSSLFVGQKVFKSGVISSESQCGLLPFKKARKNLHGLQARAVHQEVGEEAGRQSNENPLVKKMAASAVALLAAGAIVAVPVDDAIAASSSGRVGGSAFRANSSSVRVDNSRTNVYVNPAPSVVVAPATVLVAPAPVYGFGPPVVYGGWAPFSFGPTIAISGGGFVSAFLFFGVFGLILAVIASFFNRRDDTYT